MQDTNGHERKWYSFLRRVMAHIQLTLSVMMLVFFIIDRMNDAMEFLNNGITKWLMCVFAALTLVSSIMSIVAYWPREKR